MDRIDIKTTENQLRQEFIQGYGYPPRIAEALVNTVMAISDPIDNLQYSKLKSLIPKS